MPTDAPGSFDFTMLGSEVWRHRRQSLLLLTVALLGGVATSLLLPAKYRATCTLSPAPSATDRLRLGSALASLGGQFGLDVGGARTQLRFYPRLVTSYWFLSNLARVPLVGDTTLYWLFESTTPDSLRPDYPRRMDTVVDRLRKAVSVELDDRGNVFTISVVLPTRAMALAAAQKAVALITEFDTHILRLQASESRRFVEERSDSARNDLGRAEDSLTTFLAHNRLYEQSPALTLYYQRLQRLVALKQEVYLTLSRNLEEARIQEVKEAPLLTVVDPPHAAWRRAEPNRRTVVGVFLVGGIVLVLIRAMIPMRRVVTPTGDE
jgi:uncharacterized protein involved in exopolysaccharide biosynthesis